MHTSNQKQCIADDTEFRPFILEVDGKVWHIFSRAKHFASAEVSRLGVRVAFFEPCRREETAPDCDEAGVTVHGNESRSHCVHLWQVRGTVLFCESRVTVRTTCHLWSVSVTAD